LSRTTISTTSNPPPLPVCHPATIERCFDAYHGRLCLGYNPGGSKSPEELANLDAEDESLNRWKASLGISGNSTVATGPKVIKALCLPALPTDFVMNTKLTVLTLELVSPTLPAGKTISLDLRDPAQIEKTKKHPIVIKEGVEYK
jgi:Rho GDP-dissociation inhibitor